MIEEVHSSPPTPSSVSYQRKSSIKTNALFSHLRMQEELSPKTDKSNVVERVSDFELEAVVIDLLQALTVKQQMKLEGSEIYLLCRQIIDKRSKDFIVDETLDGTITIIDDTFETDEYFVDMKSANGKQSSSSSTSSENYIYNMSLTLIYQVVNQELMSQYMTITGNNSSQNNGISTTTTTTATTTTTDSIPIHCRHSNDRLDRYTRNITACSSYLIFNNYLWSYVEYTSLKGLRNSMEDRITLFENLAEVFGTSIMDKHRRCSNVSYFAILDGHGGDAAAEYGRIHLPACIIEQIKKNLAVDDNSINGVGFEQQVELIKKAVVEGYELTDERFIEIAEDYNLNSGATVLSAVIIDPPIVSPTYNGVRVRKLIIANAGDSLAVLASQGSVTTILNKQHKPDIPEEKQRITQNGGKVYHWYGQARVNGVIGVSRSLGNRRYKELIPITPDVFEYDIVEGRDEFLIMASDGLWDVMPPQEAVEFVRSHLRQNDKNPAQISQALAEESVSRKSKDNISVLILLFRCESVSLLSPLCK